MTAPAAPAAARVATAAARFIGGRRAPTTAAGGSSSSFLASRLQLLLPLLLLLLVSKPAAVVEAFIPSSPHAAHHTLAMAASSSSSSSSSVPPTIKPPIVWTIAGSDSGGGAGIQADLLAFHALGCHGCSAITALTAQNSHEVRAVQTSSLPQLRATLEALGDDLPPQAVKLGMLATAEVVGEVASFLEAKGDSLGPVICDPVMVTTSGSILLDADARALMTARVFPRAALITPNKHETEVLVGYKLTSPQDMERAARELLAMGKSRAVLVKGGHALGEGQEVEAEGEAAAVAQDYLLDGESGQGMWIASPRLANANTHGTGCTLSSATAAFLARGLPLRDAVVMAKAYVSQGIRGARQLGTGPGPVRQTGWPASPPDFPWVTATAEAGYGAGRAGPFVPCEDGGRIGLYACVDTAEWVERLLAAGVRDIQLRVKDRPMGEVDAEVGRAQAACQARGGRLWVNDYWALAVKHGAYGLHIGQEDLDALLLTSTSTSTSTSTAGGQQQSPLEAVRAAGVRLGISTHSFEELARATALRPSYISLGPIYPTASKQVRFGPQGPTRIRQWRQLVPADVPLVAIGGIGLDTAPDCLAAGADGICVISALTKAPDLGQAVRDWQALFEAHWGAGAATAAGQRQG